MCFYCVSHGLLFDQFYSSGAANIHLAVDNNICWIIETVFSRLTFHEVFQGFFSGFFVCCLHKTEHCSQLCVACTLLVLLDIAGILSAFSVIDGNVSKMRNVCS